MLEYLEGQIRRANTLKNSVLSAINTLTDLVNNYQDLSLSIDMKYLVNEDTTNVCKSVLKSKEKAEKKIRELRKVVIAIDTFNVITRKKIEEF